VELRWVDIKTSSYRYRVGSLDIDLTHLPNINLAKSLGVLMVSCLLFSMMR